MLNRITSVSVLGLMLMFFQQCTSPQQSGADQRLGLEQTVSAPKLIHPVRKAYKAPEIKGIKHWINSEPLSLEELKGKVVLIDFWTFSCINCIRTFPYIKQWHEKYHDKGLVIIGVHSPEFPFEHEVANVENAVAKNGMKYAVAMDNDFETFRNFDNQYWPAHYLIDQSGNVVYTHFGEGQYDITEGNIRSLLGLTDSVETKSGDLDEFGQVGHWQTPETYLGFARTKNFKSPESIKRNRGQRYSFPEGLPLHHWALNGEWMVGSYKSTSQTADAGLRMKFSARKVFLVLGSETGKPIDVTVKLNGETHRKLVVKEHELYTLVDLEKKGKGVLELEAATPGLEAYAFTFGS